MAAADLNLSPNRQLAVADGYIAEPDVQRAGMTVATALDRLTGRDWDSRRRVARTVARTACVLIVAVIGGALCTPAASQAARKRSCASIRVELRYAVRIERGSAPCSTARRVLQDFLVSFHAARIQPWTCTLIKDGAACFRGGHSRRTARDYITALTDPKTANDPAAAELARTAQTAAETIATDQNGSYSTVSLATIHATEPTIPIAPRPGHAYLSAAAPTNAGRGYRVSATAASSDIYTIIRGPSGSITRSCTVAGGRTSGGLCQHGHW